MTDEQLKKLEAYHDGELSGQQLREVEAWLASDPAAAAELESLREMSALFDTAFRPALPDEELAFLHDQVDATSEQAATLRISRWFTGAAAAVVVICGSLLMQSLSQSTTPDVSGLGDMIFAAQLQPTSTDDTPVESQLTSWIVADLSATSEGL